MFLCGSGEYDELTLAQMLSTLAKVVTTLCKQGNKGQQITEAVGAIGHVQSIAHHNHQNQLELHKGLLLPCPWFTLPLASVLAILLQCNSYQVRYSQTAGCDQSPAQPAIVLEYGAEDAHRLRCQRQRPSLLPGISWNDSDVVRIRDTPVRGTHRPLYASLSFCSYTAVPAHVIS